MDLSSHLLAAMAKTSSGHSSDFVCVYKCLSILGQALISQTEHEILIDRLDEVLGSSSEFIAHRLCVIVHI